MEPTPYSVLTELWKTRKYMCSHSVVISLVPTTLIALFQYNIFASVYFPALKSASLCLLHDERVEGQISCHLIGYLQMATEEGGICLMKRSVQAWKTQRGMRRNPMDRPAGSTGRFCLPVEGQHLSWEWRTGLQSPVCPDVLTPNGGGLFPAFLYEMAWGLLSGAWCSCRDDNQ